MPFLVSGCEGAALSVALSSKLPGAHPDLTLRVRTGGEGIASVDFGISRWLRWITAGRLVGRKVGQIAVTDDAGRRRASALRLRRRARTFVLRTALAGVKLDARVPAGTISVSGLGESTTAVEIAIWGARTGLLQNAASCGARHRFTASLTLGGGGRHRLSRSLLMCKTGR